MRGRLGRTVIVLTVLVVALSGVLPAALSAAHMPRACHRGGCHACRILKESFLLLRMFALPLLLTALLVGALFFHANLRADRGFFCAARTPVYAKVRMNN